MHWSTPLWRTWQGVGTELRVRDVFSPVTLTPTGYAASFVPAKLW